MRLAMIATPVLLSCLASSVFAYEPSNELQDFCEHKAKLYLAAGQIRDSGVAYETAVGSASKLMKTDDDKTTFLLALTAAYGAPANLAPEKIRNREWLQCMNQNRLSDEKKQNDEEAQYRTERGAEVSPEQISQNWACPYGDRYTLMIFSKDGSYEAHDMTSRGPGKSGTFSLVGNNLTLHLTRSFTAVGPQQTFTSIDESSVTPVSINENGTLNFVRQDSVQTCRSIKPAKKI